MKILLTGANGQLGKSFQERVPKEFELIALGSKELDITDLKQISKVFDEHNPDFVANAAAYTAVDQAEKEPDEARNINALGVKYLAEICAIKNIKLIHVSTDYVFDGTSNLPYSEDTDINPINIYGKTKAEGEQAVVRSGADYVILRTAWVFSEHGSNFLKTMMRLGADNEKLNIVSDQMGCPTYAGDITDAIITVIKAGHKKNEILHYGGDQSTSWAGFAKFIFDTAFNEGKLPHKVDVRFIKTEEYPTPAARPKNSILNSKKIIDGYGIRASNWQSAVKTIIKNHY